MPLLPTARHPSHTARTPSGAARAAVTRAAVATAAAELLEPRRLFAAVVSAPLAGTVGSPGGPDTTVDLSAHFADDAHTYVRFSTAVGDYRVKLFDQRKPVTVANFLKYVTGKRYDGTIIHRVDTLGADAGAPPVTGEPDIIQGGGYAFPGFGRIKTDPAIRNEFADNGAIGNARGTIAMAKTSDPDSATSEWFVNTADNRAALDDPANAGGFTVFGEVLAEDMAIVDAIGDVPRFNFDPDGTSPFGKIPLRNYTKENYDAQQVPTADNVVSVTAAVVPDLLTYSASSSDPALVTPLVDADGRLTLSYGAGSGTAAITVTATAPDGGPSVSSTFAAGVGQFDVQVGGDSGNQSLSFTDADGTVGTIAIKGPGSATVRLTGDELAQTTNRGRVSVTGTNAGLALVTLTGTTEATTVTIGGKGGDRTVTLGGLSANGPVKSISAKAVTLTGGLTTVGRVGSLALGNATGATITLGGTTADPGSALTIGTLTDTDLISAAPVRSLKLTTATGTDDEPDLISVLGGIDSLNVARDLAADVSVPGNGVLRAGKVGGNLAGDVSAHQIVSFSVRGDMTGASITATRQANEFADLVEANRRPNHAIGSLKVSRSVTDSVIRSAGSIGSISAAALNGTTVAAVSATSPIETLPASALDLGQEATLNVLKVKSMTNSRVAAKYFGKVSAGTINVANDGTPVGFAGDRFVSLSGRLTGVDNAGRLALKNVDAQQQVVLTGTSHSAPPDPNAPGRLIGDLVVRVL